jgi:hypothetical protein
MAPKYPAIPEPTIDPVSLRDVVMALKQAFEVLSGQRGNPDYRAVLLPELTALGADTDTGWSSFAYVNSWADYPPPFSPAGYRKLSSGLVVLRGLVQGGTAASIATLPVGYRPGVQLLFGAQTSPNNVLCRVDIETGGVISHTGGNNNWISLNGISFLAEL